MTTTPLIVSLTALKLLIDPSYFPVKNSGLK
jgi:hypothetical protein